MITKTVSSHPAASSIQAHPLQMHPVEINSIDDLEAMLGLSIDSLMPASTTDALHIMKQYVPFEARQIAA